MSGADFGILFYDLPARSIQREHLFALSTNSSDVQDHLEDITGFQTLITDQVIRLTTRQELTKYNSKIFGDGNAARSEGWIVQSFMSVPITSKSGETIGCLMLGHGQEGIFTKEAEEMVLGVVSQATVALDNAMLFEKLVSANEEKERLLEKATEQNFRKDEFLSIASHELKTPVTSMKGYLQILEKQVSKEGNGGYLPLIQKANKQVNKVIHLVNDLLNLSKLEAGKLQYNFSDFKISEVLADCIANIKNAEYKHNIRVFGDQNSVIRGDRNRIEQVIINLIDNAIKYSPDATEVLIGLSEDRGYFKLEVRDFGPGIPEEKLQLIFERYYRGEENSYKTSGLGLGLYISGEIIKRHQGRMGVESEQGKGSTFWFVIPLDQDPE
nr:GAF domain-containing sensor histidine kinase [Pedobacter sp. SYSU D00823]